MTLDHVLNSALQSRGTKAVLLLNEVHVPIAGRGDLSDTDVQSISRLLSWTDVESTGRISFNNGRWIHFHHTKSHTLALIISSEPGLGSPASSERASDPVSPTSTSLETIKGKTGLPIAET